MQRITCYASVAVLLALLPAAATHAQGAQVRGTVGYRERIALPPTAVIKVQLQDVSFADAPATILAEQTINSAGKQPPFAFELPYDPAAIDDRNFYTVSAEITDGDRLLFVTTRSYGVITRGNPTTVDLLLERVSGNSDPPPALPRTGAGPGGVLPGLLALCMVCCGAWLRRAGKH